jgi:ferrous iron transport protein B
MYFVGIAVAIPVALLFKRTLLKGAPPAFVLELPAYHLPQCRTVFFRVYEAAKQFTVRAGTIILAISVIIWALNYFPRSDEISGRYEVARAAAEKSLVGEALQERIAELDQLEAGEHQRNSYFAGIGHAFAPVFRPLGWDWRIGMAVLASFPAREVVVSTLGIIYDLGADLDLDSEEDRGKLVKKLHASTWPDGRKVFSLPVALSIMVFFALCCQCGATLVTIRREANSWKWAFLTFAYMTLLAYIGAFATYQVGCWLL